MAPPTNRAKQDELFSLFATNDPETGNPYTLERVAEMTSVPLATVGKYRVKWETKRAAEVEVADTVTRPDPARVLEVELGHIPQLNEQKVAYVLRQVHANPALIRNPHELMRLLSEVLSLKGLFAENLVHAVMAAAQPEGPPPQFWGPPPQPGAPSYAPPWMMPPPPQHAPSPWPQAPPYGAPYPYPPAWPQQPPAGVSREDVAVIVERAIERALKAIPQAPPAPETPYEESLEPIFDADGQVMADARGTPILKQVRRPFQPRGGDDFLTQLVKMREAGLIGQQDRGGDPAVEKLERRLEDLTRELAAARAPAPDSRLQEILAKQQEQNALVMANFEAERARREEAEKWQGRLVETERELRASEIERVKNLGGLPADAQVLTRGLEIVDRTIQSRQANAEPRQARLEKVVTSLLLPAPPGTVPASPTEGELEALAARQAAIDAAEAAEAPPRPPPPRPRPPRPAPDNVPPPSPSPAAPAKPSRPPASVPPTET